MKNKKKLIFNIILAILVIGLIGYIIWKLFPLLMGLVTPEGRENFRNEMNELGASSFFVLLGLQVAQILLIVLPAEPLEILSGMCYGTWGGALFITFSTFLSTVIIYFLVNMLGKKFLYQVFSKEKIDKIENSKLLRNTKRIEFIVFLLFFIPATPKDLLVYIGAILPMKPLRFMAISTFARLPSIISATMVGDSITSGNWIIPVIVYSITAVIVVIAIYISKKKAGKDTEELMKILK